MGLAVQERDFAVEGTMAKKGKVLEVRLSVSVHVLSSLRYYRRILVSQDERYFVFDLARCSANRRQAAVQLACLS